MNTQFDTVVKLAERLEEIEINKEDHVVPFTQLEMVEDNSFALQGVTKKNRPLELTDFAHGQVASRLQIPRQYYDRISTIPGLRSYNVNELLREKKKGYLVRTLEGRARAFLSDKFFCIDNFDTMKDSILPAIMPFKNDLEVKNSSLSDTRMYLQMIFKNRKAEVSKGDVVQYGLTISNSEVGALDIRAFIWRLACLNGQLHKSLFKKYHVGKRMDYENAGIYQRDTIQKELESYHLRIRDVISHSLKDDEFKKIVQGMKDAKKDQIEDLPDTIERVTKRYPVSENDGKLIMNNMIKEGNVNRYGLANGITNLAKEFYDPDKQYEMEKLGGKIIELSKSEWKMIA